LFTTSSPSLDSYLKILPRFKVRAEGEPVRFTDQVMFESVKMPSRFLSFSPGTFHDGYNVGTHEVDLSIRSSAFTILYSYSIDKKRAKFLKGGDVVYLLHKELDSYLAAEGIFTDKSILEKIHLRSKPHSELQDLDTASTDGATFFQVEVENNVTDGDPIQWETNVRLRHMISRKYLQVKNEKLSLTKEKVSLHPSALPLSFMLKPIPCCPLLEQVDGVQVRPHCQNHGRHSL